MAKQPSFQFYPGDWLKDPALQSCPSSAIGAYINLLCYAFECEPRGCLVTNGIPWTIEHAAKMGKVKPKMVRRLRENKVLRQSARLGILFSARMVRDERLRRQKRRSGRQGGQASAKQRANQSPTKTQAEGQAKSNSSSSSSPSGEEVPKGTSAGTAARPRKADPIWDCVICEFFPKLDLKKIKDAKKKSSLAKRIGKIVSDLKEFTDCTPDEIRRRRKAMVREYGPEADTPVSLAKHWSKYGKQKGARDWSLEA